MQRQEPKPVKDEHRAHPIASAWRPVLRAIVMAMVEGDYVLARGIENVAPVSDATADHIRAYIVAYGETLTKLPNDTWKSSVSQWMGTHWYVLVDLWNVESGASDLVLHLHVFEAYDGFRFEVESVYVP
jgi:hypothetical protein